MLRHLKTRLFGATSRGRLALLSGSSLGAALAALVIASGAWPPASRGTPLQLPRLSLRDNKQHLSAAEMTTLLRWAQRFRACAIRRGVLLDPAVAGEDEVLIKGRGGSRIGGRQFRRIACFREMAEPPTFSALVLTAEDGWFHLYRPRTCRLPVVGPAKA